MDFVSIDDLAELFGGADVDGVTDPGELHSLVQAGVAAIAAAQAAVAPARAGGRSGPVFRLAA